MKTGIIYGEVWSAPSTTKIEKNAIDYTPKRQAKLSYHAVRNEYESCQLIITAKEDIDSFELYSTDLFCGDERLSANYFEIYVQKYIPFKDHYGEASMPDALLPMKVANAYRENSIMADTNGALWITIYVPKQTVAGIYRGTFTLAINGKDGKQLMEIPVSVDVEDYTLPDKITARTLFSWRYDRVSAGELDGSQKMMEFYYNYFKKYRISLQTLPLGTLSGDEFVDMLLKYYDEMTSYAILSTVGDISTWMLLHEDAVKEQIFAVAKNSTSKKNLFEKAMIYFYDEPDFEKEDYREGVLEAILDLNKILQSCVDEIRTDQSNLYCEFKQIENWENSILNIPNVIPLISFGWLMDNEDTEIAQKLLHLINCICPQFFQIGDDEEGKYKSFCKKYNIALWWYGCMGPKYPHPNYHLGDRNVLSARTVSWMQRKHKIKGNLYWDAAAYTDEMDNHEYVNLYEYPFRKDYDETWVAGDGFLTYPGAPYGIYGPIPTIRLMSIRDGMEEYEILADVEKQIGEDAMEEFYTPLYSTAMKMNEDGQNGLDFSAHRSKLIKRAAFLSKGYREEELALADDSEQEELLLSFDSYEEITGAGLRVSMLFGESKVNTDRRYIIEGKGSWMIKPAGDYGNEDGYSWFRLRCKNSEGKTDTSFRKNDFSGYKKILLDVYNTDKEEKRIQMSLFACDKDGKYTETKRQVCMLKARTWTTCEYNLSKETLSDMFNLKDVKHLKVMFLDRKKDKYEEPAALYIDNLRGLKQ